MAYQNFVDKVGPVVSAAWLNAVDQGLIIAAVKQVTTSRANVITPTNDPELVIQIPAAGFYDIFCLIYPAGSPDVGEGLSWGLNYSGSFDGTASVQSLGSTTGSFGGATPISPSQGTAGFGISTSLGTVLYQQIMFHFANLIATSTGTLGLSWAQGASNATATQIGRGSWLRAFRLF